MKGLAVPILGRRGNKSALFAKNARNGGENGGWGAASARGGGSPDETDSCGGRGERKWGSWVAAGGLIVEGYGGECMRDEDGNRKGGGDVSLCERGMRNPREADVPSAAKPGRTSRPVPAAIHDSRRIPTESLVSTKYPLSTPEVPFEYLFSTRSVPHQYPFSTRKTDGSEGGENVMVSGIMDYEIRGAGDAVFGVRATRGREKGAGGEEKVDREKGKIGARGRSRVIRTSFEHYSNVIRTEGGRSIWRCGSWGGAR